MLGTRYQTLESIESRRCRGGPEQHAHEAGPSQPQHQRRDRVAHDVAQNGDCRQRLHGRIDPGGREVVARKQGQGCYRGGMAQRQLEGDDGTQGMANDHRLLDPEPDKRLVKEVGLGGRVQTRSLGRVL